MNQGEVASVAETTETKLSPAISISNNHSNENILPMTSQEQKENYEATQVKKARSFTTDFAINDIVNVEGNVTNMNIGLETQNNIADDILENLQISSEVATDESLSPTAAFLLTFPIVSSVMNRDRLIEQKITHTKPAENMVLTSVLNDGSADKKFESSLEAVPSVSEPQTFAEILDSLKNSPLKPLGEIDGNYSVSSSKFPDFSFSTNRLHTITHSPSKTVGFYESLHSIQPKNLHKATGESSLNELGKTTYKTSANMCSTSTVYVLPSTVRQHEYTSNCLLSTMPIVNQASYSGQPELKRPNNCSINPLYLNEGSSSPQSPTTSKNFQCNNNSDSNVLWGSMTPIEFDSVVESSGVTSHSMEQAEKPSKFRSCIANKLIVSKDQSRQIPRVLHYSLEDNSSWSTCHTFPSLNSDLSSNHFEKSTYNYDNVTPADFSVSRLVDVKTCTSQKNGNEDYLMVNEQASNPNVKENSTMRTVAIENSLQTIEPLKPILSSNYTTEAILSKAAKKEVFSIFPPSNSFDVYSHSHSSTEHEHFPTLATMDSIPPIHHIFDTQTNIDHLFTPISSANILSPPTNPSHLQQPTDSSNVRQGVKNMEIQKGNRILDNQISKRSVLHTLSREKKSEACSENVLTNFHLSTIFPEIDNRKETKWV